MLLKVVLDPSLNRTSSFSSLLISARCIYYSKIVEVLQVLNFINKKKQDLLCFYNTVISNRSIKQNKQKKHMQFLLKEQFFLCNTTIFLFFRFLFDIFCALEQSSFFLNSNYRQIVVVVVVVINTFSPFFFEYIK